MRAWIKLGENQKILRRMKFEKINDQKSHIYWDEKLINDFESKSGHIFNKQWYLKCFELSMGLSQRISAIFYE